MRSVSFATLVILAAATPAAAEACGGSPGFALVHSALPAPLPEGVFIAEVEIDPRTIRGYHWKGVRGRVIKVIQGEPVSEIMLQSDFTTSCDAPLANGSSGLILGLPRGGKDGVLIVSPLTVHREDGFRLADGFSVPLKCRERPCSIEIEP